jgi:hypothetical protein
VDGSKIVPLVGRLYSAEAPEFISENHEILTVVDKVLPLENIGDDVIRICK